MKLHLPYSLRKALLACLASLALPVTTYATGSVAFGSAALVSFMLSQHSFAEEESEEEEGSLPIFGPEVTYQEENATSDTLSPESDICYILNELTGNLTVAQSSCNVKIKNRTGQKITFASINVFESFWLAEGVFEGMTAFGSGSNFSGKNFYIGEEAGGAESGYGVQLRWINGGNSPGIGSGKTMVWRIGASSYNISQDDETDERWNNAAIVVTGGGTLGLSSTVYIEDNAKIVVDNGSSFTLNSTTINGSNVIFDVEGSLEFSGTTTFAASGITLRGSGGLITLSSIGADKTITLDNADLTIKVGANTSGLSIKGTGSLKVNVADNRSFSGVSSWGVNTEFLIADGKTLTLGETGNNGATGSGALTLTANGENASATCVIVGKSTDAGIINVGANVTVEYQALSGYIAGLSSTYESSVLQKQNDSVGKAIGIKAKGTYDFAGTVKMASANMGALTLDMMGTGSQTFSGTIEDDVNFKATSGSLIVSGAVTGTDHTLEIGNGTIEFKNKYNRSFSGLTFSEGATGTLKLSAGSLVLNSAVTWASGATLSLAAGSTLEIGSSGSLDLSAGSFEVTGSGSAVIKLGITGASNSGSAVLNLGDSALSNLSILLDIDSSLFEGSFDSIDLTDWIAYSGSGTLSFSLVDAEGWTASWVDNKIVLSYEGDVSGDCIWKGGDNNIWTAEDDNDSWNGGAFSANCNVIFNSANAGTVLLSGDIVTGDMTVNGGKWTFEGAESDTHTLTVGGTLDLQSNASLIYNGGSTLKLGVIQGEGSLTLASGVLDLTSASLSSESNVSLTIELGGQGMMKVTDWSSFSRLDVALSGKVTKGMKYRLFAEGSIPTDFTNDSLSPIDLTNIDSAGHQLIISYDAGFVTFDFEALDLKWAGNTALLWQEGVKGWVDNEVAEFAHEDNVTFNPNGSNNQVVLQENITAGNVSVQGKYLFNLNGHNLNASSLVVGANTTISGSGTVHADKVSGAGTLQLQGGVLDLSWTTCNSDRFLIEINLTGSGTLKLRSGDTDLLDKIQLTLAGKAKQYTLFASGSYILTEEQLRSILHTDKQYEYEASTGVLTFLDNSLVWKGGISGEWSDGCTGWAGDESLTFSNGQGVLFRDGVAADNDVTIATAGVTAGSVTVESGEWSFSGGSLSVGDDMQVGIENEAAASVVFANEVTLSGDIILQGATPGENGAETKSSITFSGASTFNKEGGTTISGGEVIFDGSTQGMYHLGDVTLGAGATMVINLTSGVSAASASAFADTTVHGDGSLVLELNSPDTLSDGTARELLSTLLSSTMDAEGIRNSRLHELKIEKGASGSWMEVWNIAGGATGSKNVLARVEKVVVGDGVTMSFSNSDGNPFKKSENLVDDKGNPITQELHLNGHGKTDSATANENKRAMYTTSGDTIAWDVLLDSDASVGSNGNGILTFSGAWKQQGHTFTIRNVTVELQNVVDAGDILVSSGTLRFNFSGLANNASLQAGEQYTQQAAKQVNLNGQTLQLTGNSSGIVYQVDSLYGGGTVGLNGSGSATLKLVNMLSSAGTENTFSGTISENITAQVGGGYWKFSGTLNGAMGVSAGTLEYAATSLGKVLDLSGTGTLKMSGVTIGTGGGIHASGGSISITDNTMNAGSLVLDNASASITNLKVNVGTVDLRQATLSGADNTISITATGGDALLKLSQTQLTHNSLALRIALLGVDTTLAKATLEAENPYVMSFLDLTGLTLDETSFNEWLGAHIDISDLGGRFHVGYYDGQVVLYGAAREMLWDGGVSGTWYAANSTDTSWDEIGGERVTDTAFATGDNVTFSSASGVAYTVALDGEITAGKMTVNIANVGEALGSLTLNAGENSSLTLSQGAVIEKGSLVVNNNVAGVYSLGNVEVKEGAEFRLRLSTASTKVGNTVTQVMPFTASNNVHGAGALVLEVDSGQWDGATKTILSTLLSNAMDAEGISNSRLHELRIEKGADGSWMEGWNIVGDTPGNSNVLARVEKVVVGDGITISFNNDNNDGGNPFRKSTNLVDNEGNHITQELHIHGHGLADSATGNATKRALYVTGTGTVEWDVVLDSDASVSSNGNGSITISGALKQQGHTLTTHNATVELRNVADAGDVYVNSGTLQYNFSALAGSATLQEGQLFSMQAAKTLDLNSKTLKLTGSEAGIIYGMEYLKSSAGTVSLDGSGSAVLKMDNKLAESVATNAFGGTIGSGITAELGSGAWRFTGTGTGALKVTGGTLLLGGSAAVNGGLTVSGGTVKLVSGSTVSLNSAVTLNGGVLDVSGGGFTKGNSGSLSIAVAGYESTAAITLTSTQLGTLDDFAITLLGSDGSALDGSTLIEGWEMKLLNFTDELTGTDALEALVAQITNEVATDCGFELTEDGTLRVVDTYESPEFVWTATTGTWTANSSAGWDEGETFTNNGRENVTFGKLSTNKATVTVGGQSDTALGVNDMTIKGDITFALDKTPIYVKGDLDIQRSAKLTLDWASGSTSGNGGRVAGLTNGNSGAVDVQLDGTLKIANWKQDGTTTHKLAITGSAHGILELACTDSSLNANTIFNLSGISFSKYLGAVKVSAGAFNLDDKLGNIGGNVTVSDTGCLEVKAGTNKSLDLSRSSAGTALHIRTAGITLSGSINLQSDSNVIEGVSGDAVTLSGTVSGGTSKHDLSLKGGAFGFTGTLSQVKKLTLGDGTTVDLGTTEEAVEISALSGAGTVKGTDKLVINGGAGESSSASISAALEKKGDGTQTLTGAISGNVKVTGGKLVFSGDSTKVSSTAITVSNGATLVSDKSTWENAGLTLTLNSGTFQTDKTVAAGSAVNLTLGTLELGTGGGSIAWSAAGTGMQAIALNMLTGSGDLNVGAMSSANGGQSYQSLSIKGIKNYNGTLSAAVSGVSKYGQGGLYLSGEVNQTEATSHGQVSLTNGEAYIGATTLSKGGAGKLSISALKVHGNSGGVQMNYGGGTFSVGKMVIESNALFKYNSAETLNGLLTWDVKALEALGEKGTIRVDLTQVGKGLLSVADDTWYDLGIVDTDGTYANDAAALESLRQKLYLANIELADGQESYLAWKEVNGENHLHIALGDYTLSEGQWDEAWNRYGDIADNGPDAGTMLRHVYNGTDDYLTLGAEDSGYSESSRSMVRLTGGGSDTATVIGGARYTGTDEVSDLEDMYTYISMKVEEGTMAHYHLLVGGSSCEVTSGTPAADAEAAGGFSGETHIQMSGGEVDYIVGGNHVTNSAFYFEGDSYISVLKGSEVSGGIVGGSTLTKGAAADNDVYEFDGDSHIFIYQALGNKANAADTPEIRLGDDETGARFTAVVGGNAWVQLPAGEAAGMAPTFRGDAYIVIDLTAEEKSAGGEFAKEIVGGNYTAFKGSKAQPEDSNRSTVFEGDTSIRITAANTDNFSGGVSGASRRASGGGGATIFTGDTNVEITGGNYTEAVAGGMWFEGTANGDHSSLLDGATHVTLNDGKFWRVVGGSYSLQGGAGAGEVQTGDSQVVVNSGTFVSKGTGYAQMDIGFVAGGDFYRNNSGTNHSHTANAMVTLNGGTYESVHIVGGDYANASTPSGEATNLMHTVISGITAVNVGCADANVDIVGLVVGGSYLTDDGAGGAVEVQGGTNVIIGGHAKLSDQDGHPQHRGLAIVGGHVVVDGGSGDATGGHQALVGGDTVITVQSGAVIAGAIVGGSYVNSTDNANMLSSKNVKLQLAGGTITGSVYGGHYTESTQGTPDSLEVGNITINMDGSVVTGNIVGGGRRATVTDEAGTSKQGAINVNLNSGTLVGNVYAAGYNAGVAGGSANTVTESTTVTIGKDFVFRAGEPDSLNEQGSILISGGYGRADANVGRGSITKEAVLKITDANASIAQNADQVIFANFSAVDVAADTAVTTKLYVLRRDGASQSFEKRGAGTLSVSGLTMWDSTDAGSVRPSGYTGSILVDNGALALTGDDDQSLAGGLAFNMANLKINNASTAYLRAIGNGCLTLDTRTSLDIIVDGVTSLARGEYYLVSGLAANITQDRLDDLFDTNWDDLEALSSDFDYTLLVKGSCLVLSVADKGAEADDEWIWEGYESGIWSGESTNWNQSGNGATPNTQDVYFRGQGTGEVSIVGMVSPRSVWVQNGEYEFIAKDATSGGLNIGGVGEGRLASGELAVGGSEDAELYATLKLSLRNTHIGRVSLLERGTLILNHAEAVSADTEVVFGGGVLAYEAGAEGTVDVSTKVRAADANSIVRVRVDGLNITWGDSKLGRADNSGVALATERGIEKTGADSFRLVWRETEDARLTGSIAAQEGTLEYVLSAAKHTVRFAGDGVIAVGNAASVLSAERTSTPAMVAFSFAEGAEGTMRFEKAFAGDGVVRIGGESEAGEYVLAADNNAFAGTIRLVGAADGGLVTAAEAGALGGANTTLALAGRSFAFANGMVPIVSVKEIVAEAGTLTYVGGRKLNAANRSITLASAISGSGSIANAVGGFAHVISGDLSGFTGSIIAGYAGSSSSANASTWTLKGKGGDVQANLAGTGSIILNYTDTVRLTGRVGADDANNSVALQNTGSRVIIADADANGVGKNTSTGLLKGTQFYLGDEKGAGTWAGSGLDGELELVNGTLTHGITTKTANSYLSVETAKTKGGTIVNAGGTDGSLFDDIVIHSGGHLAEVSGKLTIGSNDKQTSTWLYFGAENVGDAASSASTDYLMEVQGGAVVADVNGFVLDFSAEGFMAVLKAALVDNEAWLHVVDHELTINPRDYQKLLGTDDPNAYYGDDLPVLLRSLGFETQGVQGGDIILSGEVKEVYLVLADNEKTNAHHVEGYNVLSAYKATVVDEGESLSLTLKGAPDEGTTDGIAGGAVVNNLVGLEDSSFTVTNGGDASERVSVVLNNESRVINNTEGHDEVRAQNTMFKGTISGGTGVDIVKTGAGVLTIGSEETGEGGLALAEGDVKLVGGGLRLLGKSNSMHSLTFAWTGEDKIDTCALTLSGGKTTLETIREAAEYTDAAGAARQGGNIVLLKGAELEITGNTMLEDSTIAAGDKDGGTLTLSSGAELKLAADHAQLEKVTANLQIGTTLNVGASAGNTLAGLMGYGRVLGQPEAELTITGTGSVFCGALDGAGVLNVAKGAEFTLMSATGNATSASSNAWILHNRGSLAIDITEAEEGLWLEELKLHAGSLTTLTLDTDRSNGGLLGGGWLSIDQGADLIINSIGKQGLTGSSVTLASFSGDDSQLQLDAEHIILQGMAFLHSSVDKLYFDNGQLKLDLTERKENAFITPNMGKNERAGAELLWDVTDQSTEGWKYIQANPGGDLSGLAHAAQAAYDDGTIESMAGTMAAAAGASVSVLSSAVAQDIQRQLSAVRNRSSMIEPVYDKHADMPSFHLWLTGEGSYHKMDASGSAPGYTLNGWGGSVGVDMDVNAGTTMGLALTAMYNDLKTSSADAGKGDVDATYLSAYARTTRGAWTHTLVGSVGTADVSLNRTVNYGLLSSYTTYGSTDGVVAGFMYEVGYSIVLDPEASVLVQPVFNVQYSHAAVNGYTETGSDAGLWVDNMEYNTLTLGLGARLQSVVGSNVFNRMAIVEARAMLKADVGDRSGKAGTSFINAGRQAEVESAKVGAIGIEVGAGVSVPLGKRSGTIFFDGSAEFRSGYSSLNASAGYRINF